MCAKLQSDFTPGSSKKPRLNSDQRSSLSFAADKDLRKEPIYYWFAIIGRRKTSKVPLCSVVAVRYGAIACEHWTHKKTATHQNLGRRREHFDPKLNCEPQLSVLLVYMHVSIYARYEDGAVECLSFGSKM